MKLSFSCIAVFRVLPAQLKSVWTEKVWPCCRAPDKKSSPGLWREKLLPPLGHGPVVHAFHSQSVTPPNGELHAGRGGNDPGAVKTVHALNHYEHCHCRWCTDHVGDLYTARVVHQCVAFFFYLAELNSSYFFSKKPLHPQMTAFNRITLYERALLTTNSLKTNYFTLFHFNCGYLCWSLWIGLICMKKGAISSYINV